MGVAIDSTSFRGSVTRGDVLDRAANLFALNGYRSTSLELVADQLGVTRQALYYHFSSKGEILGALFDQVMTELESTVKAVCRSHGETVPNFSLLLEGHVDTTLANLDLVAVLLHERPEIAKIKNLRAAKRRSDYAHLFTAAYEKGVADGSLSAVDSWVAVNTILAAVNGVSTWYHGESVRTPRREFRENLLKLLMGGYYLSNGASGTR